MPRYVSFQCISRGPQPARCLAVMRLCMRQQLIRQEGNAEAGRGESVRLAWREKSVWGGQI
jgi:hypothetical protein